MVRLGTYVNKQEAIKVWVRLRHKRAVRLVDAGVAVVGGRISLRLDTFRGILLESLYTQSLEGCKGPSASLDGVSGRNQVRGRVRNVSGRVRVLESFFTRIHRPRCDMDLLTLRDVERLEEGVHVLPAVQLTETTKFSLSDRLESITSTITVDQFLNMGRLDLSAVVDDLACWVNQSLSEVQGGMVNLGEAKRDVAGRCQRCLQVQEILAYIWLSRAARRIRLNSSESIGREFSRYFFSRGSDCW